MAGDGRLKPEGGREGATCRAGVGEGGDWRGRGLSKGGRRRLVGQCAALRERDVGAVVGTLDGGGELGELEFATSLPKASLNPSTWLRGTGAAAHGQIAGASLAGRSEANRAL
jgi:hypothetical protein